MVLSGYVAMRDQLLASNLNLKAASMSARQGWQLVLDNDVRLELGRKDNENGSLALLSCIRYCNNKQINVLIT